MRKTDKHLRQTHTSDSLRSLLNADHVRLDQLFDDLLEAICADACEDIAKLWSKFDEGLRKHMEIEEESILPELKKVNREEARELAREHAHIRTKLMELGIGLDLHLIRAEAVSSFIDALRAHARREDALMYRWADAELPKGSHVSVRSHLSRVRGKDGRWSLLPTRKLWRAMNGGVALLK